MQELTNRIDNLLAENKKKRADVVRGTGISEGCIRGWYKGQVPSADALLKVAKYFSVTVEWLLTGEDASVDGCPVLNPEERALIDTIRKLDRQDKDMIIKLAQRLAPRFSVDMREKCVAN